MASVTLKSVYKYYENSKEPAVKDFNLEIGDGEFVVFVGPSGCGKSTTLRMIAGLEDISQGEIYIDDVLVNEMEPKDRDIAMVFQNYALYPSMTVYNNMAFGLRLKKILDYRRNKDGSYRLDKNGKRIPYKRHYTNAEIDEKVIAAAKILEIQDYLERKPKALSGGQRQRVAIGRAIVRSPKAFLMDEPLSNLDAKLRNQMRGELILLRQKIQTTFIYVTHDQVEAVTLGDRIVVMKDGIIQQVGTPVEVFNKPANLFVAGFIGTPQMNFFDGTLSRKGEGWTLVTLGREYVLPADISRALDSKGAQEGEITVGVRPDYFSFGKMPGEGIAAEVIIAEMMGTEHHLHVKVGDVTLTIKVPFDPSLSGESMKNSNGEKRVIYCDISLDKIQLFSKADGGNLVY